MNGGNTDDPSEVKYSEVMLKCCRDAILIYDRESDSMRSAAAVADMSKRPA